MERGSKRKQTLTQSAGEVANVAIIAAVAPDYQYHPQSRLPREFEEVGRRDIPHPEYIRPEGTPHSGNINRAISLVFILTADLSLDGGSLPDGTLRWAGVDLQATSFPFS
jgi:hypothetical protein